MLLLENLKLRMWLTLYFYWTLLVRSNNLEPAVIVRILSIQCEKGQRGTRAAEAALSTPVACRQRPGEGEMGL